jgi:CHAT domain-containing protein/tetratricopeptide (TPR) repeat protein
MNDRTDHEVKFATPGWLVSRNWILVATLSIAGGFQTSVAAIEGIQTPPDQHFAIHTIVERELAGGEVLSFPLELAAGEYLRLALEASGIRIRTKILDPNGSIIREDPCRLAETTQLSLIAEDSGVYHLEARGVGADGDAKGRFLLRIDEKRVSTAQDQARIRAETLFSEADELRLEYEEDKSRRAIERYDLAAEAWLMARELEQAARAQERIGTVHLDRAEFQDAIAAYEEGLRLARDAGAPGVENEILSELGIARVLVGDAEAALESCKAVRSSARDTGRLRAEAKALNCLGEAHYHLGSLNDALESYQKARPIWVSLGDVWGEAQTSLYLGYSYSDSSRVDEAREHYDHALSRFEQIEDKRGRALTLVALGRLRLRLGENQQALNLFNDALTLLSPMGDPVWEASVSAGIGSVYFQMNEYEQALVYKRQSAELFRRAHLRMAEMESLLSLGEVSLASGDPQGALRNSAEAFSLAQELGNTRYQSRALSFMGMVHRSTGDLETALGYYERALTTMRREEDPRSEAGTLGDIGEIHERRGDWGEALSFYHQALELSRSSGDRFGEANWLYRKARVERDRDSLGLAREYLMDALKVAESLRRGVESKDLRSSYFASIQPYYELYVDVLMGLSRVHPEEKLAAAAFQASERARARSFLEMLTEARVDIRQGVDADLLERERVLKERVAEREEHQVQLLSRGASEAESAPVAEEIQQLRAEDEQLQSLIRSKSPRYAALTQPEPLSLEEVQRDVLDDGTLLLEYSLGEKNSYLWAVSETHFSSHVLPPRGEIESRTRNVHGLLTARLPSSGESMRDYRLRIKDADSRYWEEAARLSDILLGPVAREIEGKRLVIVSDGALQYLPFSALPVPSRADYVPLVVEHEVAWLPSASLLAVSRRENAGRETAPKIVALFADPVFETDDPRVGGSRTEKPAPNQASALTRALRDFGFAQDGVFRVPRLPGTLREAEAILGLVPEGSSMKATGFAASRSLAMSPELSQYRIVHFATHGLMNSDHAELSGILLSMRDPKGQPQNGFLRLHDIYNLDLRADLVVLSACNTALGKEVRGEGLVGLARGFMYSGAKRVLASFWKVDDEATGELMKRVYQGMLAGNLPPAAALREAQVSMWREKQWTAPFYWSAFSLQGDWR